MPPIPMPTVALDLTGMENLLVSFDREALVQAFRQGALQGAEMLRGQWYAVAVGLRVRHSGAYLAAIESSACIHEVSLNADPESSYWEMVVDVTNNAQHASIIEDGHEAFHMPSRVNWNGPNVKTTKNGVKYLSIPFRHSAFVGQQESDDKGYTTAAIKARMPQHISEEAQALSYTTRLGAGRQHDAAGRFVAADRYNRGGRLSRPATGPRFVMGGPGAPAGIGAGHEEHRSERQVGRNRDGTPMVNPAWGGSKYDGLFKSGTTGHSQYMTIRTMTQNSPGWNIPAQQGLHIARSVASAAAGNDRLQNRVMAAITQRLIAESGGS